MSANKMKFNKMRYYKKKLENINQVTSNVATIVLPEIPVGRKKLLEDKIVSLVLKNPENLNLIEGSHNCLFCDKTKNIIENIKNSAMK